MNTQEKLDNLLKKASKHGELELVKYCLREGADIHAENDVALKFASMKGHLQVVKYLVSKGADGTKIFNIFGETAIYLASRNGHLEVVQYLESLK
jgi:hypothetical protein